MFILQKILILSIFLIGLTSLIEVHKTMEETLIENSLYQEQALEEGKKAEEMQAARISELEGNLTTKDTILKQTLRSNKLLENENA